MDRRGTAAIARQARKSARRDVSTSGKRFDAACRAIAAALRVAPGGPPTASKALTVAPATLPRLILVDREPPDAMTRLSMVRNPGQPGVLPRPRHDPQTEATSYHRGAGAYPDPTPSAAARRRPRDLQRRRKGESGRRLELIQIKGRYPWPR